MLGGVPVRVNNPPVFDPNATGINTLEGIVPIFHAEEIVTGNKVATVPVLLTIPDKKPEPKVIITNNFVTLLPASCINFFPASAVQPVFHNPSPIIKSAAIIITVGLLKPVKVSFKSKIPVKNKLNIEINAIISGGYFPQINNSIVTNNMMNIVVNMKLIFAF